MKGPKLFFANSLLVIVSLFICLALSEIFLRILFPLEATIYESDSVLLHKLIPGSEKTFIRRVVNGGDRIHVSINGDGFRAEEIDNYHDSNLRVVVYGDSFIEAEFSKVEDTFVKQLEKDLSNTFGKSANVLNAGVVAYGPDQIGIKMQQELPLLKPDLVVVSIFAGNDYGDLIRNKIYRIRQDGKFVMNEVRIDENAIRKMAEAKKLQYTSELRTIKLMRTIARKFISSDWVDETLKRSRRDFDNFKKDKSTTVVDLLYDHYDVDIAVDPSSDSAIYKLELMKKVLNNISMTAAENDVRLLMLIIPSPTDVCENYNYKIDSSKYAKYDPARLSASIEQMADQLGIDHLNLYPIFRSRTDVDSLYFRHGDDHWNDAGQNVAAQAVTEKIISMGYFDKNRK